MGESANTTLDVQALLEQFKQENLPHKQWSDKIWLGTYSSLLLSINIDSISIIGVSLMFICYLILFPSHTYAISPPDLIEYEKQAPAATKKRKQRRVVRPEPAKRSTYSSINAPLYNVVEDQF